MVRLRREVDELRVLENRVNAEHAAVIDGMSAEVESLKQTSYEAHLAYETKAREAEEAARQGSYSCVLV